MQTLRKLPTAAPSSPVIKKSAASIIFRAPISTGGIAHKDETQDLAKRHYVVCLEPKCFHLHTAETFPIIPLVWPGIHSPALIDVRSLYPIFLPIKGELDSWHEQRKHRPGFLLPISHHLLGRSGQSR